MLVQNFNYIFLGILRKLINFMLELITVNEGINLIKILHKERIGKIKSLSLKLVINIYTRYTVIIIAIISKTLAISDKNYLRKLFVKTFCFQKKFVCHKLFHLKYNYLSKP